MNDIPKMSEIELKAMAYDLLVQNEQIQRSLQMINQEIAKRQIPQESKGK